MGAKETAAFVRSNLEYMPILEKALAHEEANGSNAHYLGWEWHDVEAYPARLMHLVVNGMARVNFKSRRATCYLLKDAQAVQVALAGIS